MAAFVPRAPLLVVDDDPDAHFLLGRSLVRAEINNQLDTATDCEMAMDYFERCARGEQPWPAVVFLDIKIPGMGGFAMLDWLRERGMLGRTVVAMMSSSDAPTDVGRAFSLGAHTYLNKNATPEVLGPIVKAALRISQPRNHLSESP
jgi:DNA-binding response OmpR family regulator